MKTNVLFKKLSLNLMITLSVIFLGVISSCSNNEDYALSEEERLKLQEEELLSVEENSDTDFLLPNGEYSFIFEGKTYTYTLEDDKITCDNNTQQILNYLQSFGEQLITIKRPDNTIEYIISEEEYQQKYIEPLIEARGTNDGVYRAVHLVLYRNKKYWGSRKHFDYDSREGENATNTGVTWGISSIKAEATHIIAPLKYNIYIDFHDQYNLQGRKLVYTETFNLNVRNLKDVPLYPGSSENWNDRIKSLRMY